MYSRQQAGYKKDKQDGIKFRPTIIKLSRQRPLTIQMTFSNKYGASQVVLVVMNLPANAGDIKDTGSIPRSGRSPGEGNGNPLQYSCLGNPKVREAWLATIHGVAKELDMT